MKHSDLIDAASLFQCDHEKLQKLGGGFENEIYGHNFEDHRCVIRITPPEHKTINEVKAELDWMIYLAENKAPVERPIPSVNNNLVEAIDTDYGKLSVVCFEWASGHRVTSDDFTPDLFRTWGKAVGLMHRLTKDYRPNVRNRIEWYDDEYLSRDLIPSDQPVVLRRFDELIMHFKNLPKNRDSYGLIHQDVHQDNLFIDNERLTILDFDDCVYGFFIFDIANALGFTLWEKPDTMTNVEFAEYYLAHFMQGYSKENQLDEFWMEQLPLAMKMFEFIHYNAFCMDYNLASGGSYDALDQRTKNILTRYRKSIEEGLPYIPSTFCPYR